MSTRSYSPDLSLIPPTLHDLALADWEAGDVEGFLGRSSNELSVAIVARNCPSLKHRGLLEEAFTCAMTATRTNNHRDYPIIRRLVRALDRARLLGAGDPIPGGEPWTLYRGVGGVGAARRVRGFSWTTDAERAAWFASRAGTFGLRDPGVYVTMVSHEHVLFYSNAREEKEFFLDLAPTHPVKRVGRAGFSDLIRVPIPR